jgi:hypothetical protein
VDSLVGDIQVLGDVKAVETLEGGDTLVTHSPAKPGGEQVHKECRRGV